MALSLEQWKGKVAVVTGASAGIGAGIAERLVKSGLLVVGFARRKELMNELAAKLSNEPGKLYPIKVDLTVENDILEAFAWIRSNLGGTSILINNAGIPARTALIDGETEDWAEVLNLNILAPCITTREAIKDMRANGVNGHIIHMNGVSGHFYLSLVDIGLAGASKFALKALTENLRLELLHAGSKIKITSISPGAVDTTILHKLRVKGSFSVTDIPKLNVSDIADAVSYVLSTPPHVQVHEIIIRPVGEIL